MNELTRPARVRAVAVTGVGTVNGLGTNCESFWQRLLAGESGVGQVTSFDSGPFRTHIACEIKAPLPETGHPDRVYDLAMSAAREALAQAGPGLEPESTAVVLGTLQGGTLSLEQTLARNAAEQKNFDVTAAFPAYPLSGLSRYVASVFGFQGPVAAPVIACAASGAAIGRALDLIRLGRARAVICGGADAFCMTPFTGFSAMRSMEPSQSRPFSVNHAGLVIGEGAGVLILEDLAAAQARGAKILALVLGAGMSCDANHITAPNPTGDGAARAMKAALADAGLAPEDIDYVNAHGTGTPHNDHMETHAIKKALGKHAYDIPVSSIKAAVGHCMGAAGAVEAVASVLTLQRGMIPPTLNFQSGDPQCDLDYVPNQARAAAVHTVLSNSFGFAGNNACLIFGQAPSGTEGMRA